jgi:hypothetical protein
MMNEQSTNSEDWIDQRKYGGVTHVWFSDYFGVELTQFELPFVDFDLNADVPLYIDPYAITKDPTELGARCHNSIFSFFQTLLEAIRDGKKNQIKRLISRHLSEPHEIHLGVSHQARGGRGIGIIQEGQVVEALANSTAAKVGVIQAIEELELHIVGIGPDKISDLIGNIIRGELSEYTEEICQQYGIPTNYIAVSGFWNSDQRTWDGGYFNLPSRNTHSYILVPKRFVRRPHDLLNHQEFYQKYMLTVLQSELLDANDSLVETLKSGERRVTKKSIIQDPRFKINKEFISQFIIDQPDVMQIYRNDLMDRFKPVDPAVPSEKSIEEDPLIQIALDKLETIPYGQPGASAYHNTIFTLVQFVFDWALEGFEKEYKMDNGRSRIDILANNYASGGLFKDFIDQYHARTIPMECKNYNADLGNDQFNQIMERLGPHTSQLGMIFCRKIEDLPSVMNHLTDRWLRHECLILILDDELVKQLTLLRLERNISSIQSLLRRLIRAVEYRSPNMYQ